MVLRSVKAGVSGGVVGAAAMDVTGVLLWPHADQATRYGVATQRVARVCWRLSRRRGPVPRHVLPLLVHLTAGMLAGALYGALAPRLPALRAGRGGLFGAALWLAGDEIAMPVLGLSPSPADVPLRVHAYTFLTHLAYGLVTDRAVDVIGRRDEGSALQLP